MANINGRYYGNKKGATIPLMTRISIEAYQTIAAIADKIDAPLNQVGVAFLEYALSHAELEECTAHRLKFKMPYGEKLDPGQQKEVTNE